MGKNQVTPPPGFRLDSGLPPGFVVDEELRAERLDPYTEARIKALQRRAEPQPQDKFTALIDRALGGLAGWGEHTAGMMGKGAEAIGKLTGTEPGGLFREEETRQGARAEYLGRKGIQGAAGDVAAGLGGAVGDIASITALGGGLPGMTLHGGLSGLAEGGLEEAAVGAARGALTHGTLKGIGGLPSKARVPAALGFGATTEPGDTEEKAKNAVVWAVLQSFGGGRKKSLREFMTEHPRVSAAIKKNRAKLMVARAKKSGHITDKEVSEAGGAEKLMEDAYKEILKQADQIERQPEQPFTPKGQPPAELLKQLPAQDVVTKPVKPTPKPQAPEYRIGDKLTRSGEPYEISDIKTETFPAGDTHTFGVTRVKSGETSRLTAKEMDKMGFQPELKGLYAGYPILKEGMKAARGIEDTLRQEQTILPGQESLKTLAKPPRVVDTLEDFARSTPQKMVDSLFDRYYPVNRFVAEAEKITGKEVSLEEHPYWGLRTLGGREGLVVNAEERLRKIFSPFKKSKKDLQSYLMNMRFIERANRGIKNPGGVTAEKAVKDLTALRKRIGPERAKEIAKVGREFWSWADKEILQRLLDGKVINKKGYQRIKSQNKYWLPFEIEADRETIADQFNIDKKGNNTDFFPIAQNAIFGMRGTTERVGDPFTAVRQRLSVAIHLAEKNKILYNLVKMRQKRPWVQKQIQRVSGSGEAPRGMGEFGVVIGGKVQKWTAPKDVVHALKNMTEADLNFLEKGMSIWASGFRAGTTTYYLPFSIFNVQRDLQMAALTSKHGFSARDWARGALNAIPSSYGLPTGLYREYLESKAGFGGLIHRPPESGTLGKAGGKSGQGDIFKSKGRIFAEETLNPAKFIKNFSGALETATRLGVYSKSRKYTSELESGLHSRSSTIDFSRAGNVMKIANKFVPFINARMQAKVSLGEALGSKSGIRSGKGHFFGKEGDPRQLAALRGLTLITKPALLLYAYNRLYHSDAYDDLPEDYKERYFPIILGEDIDEKGNKKYRLVPIPKGDWGAVVFNPIQNFLDWATVKKPIEMKEVFVNLLDELSPIEFERDSKFALDRLISGVLPPPLRGALTAATGRNLYWGRDIVPQSMKMLEPEEQYTEKTGGIYKKAGKLLSESPMVLQQTVREFFGSVFDSPSAGGMLAALRRRAVRDVGGETVNRVYRLYDKAQTGYYTARKKALDALKDGNMRGARIITETWNRSIGPVISEMSQVTEQPIERIEGSSLYQGFTFQESDWKRLVRDSKTLREPYLERQLGFKIK